MCPQARASGRPIPSVRALGPVEAGPPAALRVRVSSARSPHRPLTSPPPTSHLQTSAHIERQRGVCGQALEKHAPRRGRAAPPASLPTPPPPRNLQEGTIDCLLTELHSNVATTECPADNTLRHARPHARRRPHLSFTSLSEVPAALLGKPSTLGLEAGARFVAHTLRKRGGPSKKRTRPAAWQRLPEHSMSRSPPGNATTPSASPTYSVALRFSWSATRPPWATRSAPTSERPSSASPLDRVASPSSAPSGFHWALSPSAAGPRRRPHPSFSSPTPREPGGAAGVMRTYSKSYAAKLVAAAARANAAARGSTPPATSTPPTTSPSPAPPVTHAAISPATRAATTDHRPPSTRPLPSTPVAPATSGNAAGARGGDCGGARVDARDGARGGARFGAQATASALKECTSHCDELEDEARAATEAQLARSSSAANARRVETDAAIARIGRAGEAAARAAILRQTRESDRARAVAAAAAR